MLENMFNESYHQYLRLALLQIFFLSFGAQFPFKFSQTEITFGSPCSSYVFTYEYNEINFSLQIVPWKASVAEPYFASELAGNDVRQRGKQIHIYTSSLWYLPLTYSRPLRFKSSTFRFVCYIKLNKYLYTHAIHYHTHVIDSNISLYVSNDITAVTTAVQPKRHVPPRNQRPVSCVGVRLRVGPVRHDDMMSGILSTLLMTFMKF